MVDYGEFAKTRDPQDFWGQVRRTVGGKPIGQDQIDLIVEGIASGLQLAPGDIVLDLCCGNGALSRLVFERCAGGLGVDAAESLIDIAKLNFEISGREDYLRRDVIQFVRTCPEPERFDKALWYASLAYFDDAHALELLSGLAGRFANLRRVFVGNVPDRNRMSAFFKPGAYRPGLEDDPHSDIGVWRTEEGCVRLAREAGWEAEVVRMPSHFYQAHYRYDLVLTRPGC